jgi:hypothetical protein
VRSMPPPPPSLSVALFVDQFRWACLQCWSQLQQLTSARLPGGYKSSATNTSLGAYIGRRLVSDTLSLDEFVGIPFAADTATTRFAPPADVESAHSQPFEALSFGPPAAAGRAKVAVRAPRTAYPGTIATKHLAASKHCGPLCAASQHQPLLPRAAN